MLLSIYKSEQPNTYPIALAIYPKVLTVALLMAFLWALSSSSSSKQILIHSLADTYSGPKLPFSLI